MLEKKENQQSRMYNRVPRLKIHINVFDDTHDTFKN